MNRAIMNLNYMTVYKIKNLEKMLKVKMLKVNILNIKILSWYINCVSWSKIIDIT